MTKFKQPSLVHALSQIYSVHDLQTDVFKIRFNIITPSTPWSYSWSFPRNFPQHVVEKPIKLNTLNAKLNTIYHFLALLGSRREPVAQSV